MVLAVMCRSSSSLNLKNFSSDLSSKEVVLKAVGVIDCFLNSTGLETAGMREGVRSRDLLGRVGDFVFSCLETSRSRISVDLQRETQSLPN